MMRSKQHTNVFRSAKPNFTILSSLQSEVWINF